MTEKKPERHWQSWLLETGCWSLAVGHWLLAAGWQQNSKGEPANSNDSHKAATLDSE
jgi:hypothetical protein